MSLKKDSSLIPLNPIPELASWNTVFCFRLIQFRVLKIRLKNHSIIVDFWTELSSTWLIRSLWSGLSDFPIVWTRDSSWPWTGELDIQALHQIKGAKDESKCKQTKEIGSESHLTHSLSCLSIDDVMLRKCIQKEGRAETWIALCANIGSGREGSLVMPPHMILGLELESLIFRPTTKSRAWKTSRSISKWKKLGQSHISLAHSPVTIEDVILRKCIQKEGRKEGRRTNCAVLLFVQILGVRGAL